MVENWNILIIPFIAALVGWATNVLAIRMTFYPMEFKGWIFSKSMKNRSPINIYLGWQGIIPSKAGRITGKTVDLLTSQLISVEEQFARIDPHVAADEMAPRVTMLSKQIINEAMEEQIPLIWKLLPERQKKAIYEDAAKEFPIVVEEIMADVKDNISELFDLRGMAVKAFTTKKEMLNELFLTCGREEFRFIKHSGLYFGFLFGLIQMVIWNFIPIWWILPLGGLFVGFATNWLALKMIFHPAKPIKILKWKIQGLFIKRQKEVATEYAALVTNDILTPPNIFETILKGNGADKLMSIIEEHVLEGVDNTAGINRTLIELSVGNETYEAIKAKAFMRFIEEVPKSIKDVFDYADYALDIENTLRQKMIALKPEQFVGVLRPAFQEDEWKLILTGSVLGGIAGFIQLLLFFL